MKHIIRLWAEAELVDEWEFEGSSDDAYRVADQKKVEFSKHSCRPVEYEVIRVRSQGAA